MGSYGEDPEIAGPGVRNLRAAQESRGLFGKASGESGQEPSSQATPSIEEFPIGSGVRGRAGVDREGKKLPLGFWEGATENHEICEELLEELERRGLKLSKRILWVTDGGGGIIKALKDRYGKKLIHQRCTLHKDRATCPSAATSSKE